MSRNSALFVRSWRMRPWNTNPLMRGSDRLEGALRLLVIGVMLAMVSIAGAVGTAGYSDAVERIRSENAAKVAVSATVLAEPVEAASNGPYRKPDFQAPVRWSRNGESGSATVTVSENAALGSEVRIWLGPEGKPVDPPQPPSVAVSAGIGAGLAVLMLTWIGGLLLVWSVNRLLAQRRAAQWDAEWRSISRPIGT